MEVRIDRPAGRFDIFIYVYEGETALSHDKDGNLIYTPLKGGEEMPYFLRLNERTFEAIVRAGGKVVPFGDEAAEALRDTRATRDRLLAVVERLVERYV